MKAAVEESMTGTGHPGRSRKGVLGAAARLALAVLGFAFSVSSIADTICASAQIQLNQQLTLERQAFDAQMTIANGLDTTSLTNVSVSVSFTDANGNSVRGCK